jgi:hypothetical protein
MEPKLAAGKQEICYHGDNAQLPWPWPQLTWQHAWHWDVVGFPASCYRGGASRQGCVLCTCQAPGVHSPGDISWAFGFLWKSGDGDGRLTRGGCPQ